MAEPKSPTTQPAESTTEVTDTQLDELADSMLEEIGGGATTGGGPS